MYNFIARITILFFCFSAAIAAASSVIIGLPLALASMLIFLAGIPTVRIFLQIHGRERDIRPLEYGKLPRVFRRYVDEVTADMEQLGLEYAGDFQIYPQPLTLHSRAFLGCDGTCFGYLAVRSRKRFYGFKTVFEDGTYFETCPLRDPGQRPDDAAPLRFGYKPGATLKELFAFHQEQVLAIEKQRETRPMRFVAEQYQEVAEYGYRLVDWDLYQKGYRILEPESAKERATALRAGVEETELVAAQ